MQDIIAQMKHINILVVDDMEAIRSMVKACLRELGAMRIDLAIHGKDAWNKAQKKPYDMIICDWDMPSMTGIEFLQAIRTSEDHAHIPFLLLTASTEKDRVVEAIDAGVNDYLSKPFKPKELEFRVIKLMRKVITNKK